MQTSLVIVGVDVANACLDIAVRPSDESLLVPHDTTGITAVIARLSQLRPTRIVLEVTGGMERDS
jgi:transposase